MADLGKEEVPYSADDYLPSSPPSLEKKRKIAASESPPHAGANRSPSDVRTSTRAEEGELQDGGETKHLRGSSPERRHDDSRDRRRDRDDRSSRRSLERDDRNGQSRSDRSNRDKERDHDRERHSRRKEARSDRDKEHERRDRRDDHRRERSHSRDRDREKDRDRSGRDKEKDRRDEHRDRSDRGRNGRSDHRNGDRDRNEKRKGRSPEPQAEPAPPAPEPVLLNVVVKSQEEHEEEERMLIEERRKRRQELMAKLQQQSQPSPLAPVAASAKPATSAVSPVAPIAAPTTPPKGDDDMFGEMTAAETDRLDKEKARVEAEEQQRQEREEEAQAEADRKALEKLWAANPEHAAAPPPPEDELLEAKDEAKQEVDEFDMFADSPSKIQEKVVPLKVLVERREQNPDMIDNWDDSEGYYKFRIGEVLADRFVVFNAYGKGVFSSVVRAKDLQNAESEVAIKLIRNNDVMYKAGQKELMILGLIRDADPENKRHCVRLLHQFEFRSHLCLVMEPLAMNLREVIRKYGKDVGLNITAVKLYAKQMFIALRHLRKCNIVHADIKPDNILVNESKTTLKLCDFGSASLASENDITPYLVSRFYRAPEISCQYDFALDMWSIGCCLVELYTGKILFEKGRTNNQMLRLMMEMRGKIPNKVLKKAMPLIRSQHFDDDLNFINKTLDPVTKKETSKPMQIVQPTRDLGVILNVSSRYLPEKDQKEVAQFKDLLERIFTFETAKRITPKEALQHPFISGVVPTALQKK